MKKFDLWKLSLLNVFAAPVRSALTVLGMAIGIGAILAVLTLGEAGKTQVRSEMGRLGIDKVWLSAAAGGTLRQGDAQMVGTALDTQAAEMIFLTGEVAGKGQKTNLMIVGCDSSYLNMTGASLCEGRMLYPLEWQQDSQSALLGSSAAQTLGVHAGDVISVEGLAFKVRGILGESSVFSKVDTAQAAFLPVKVLAGLTGGVVHEMMLDVPRSLMPQTVAALAEDVMASKRSQPVQTLTLQVQLEAANSVIGIFVEVLKWVALICMLVGGIGVMNILLVSVRERRREIGVMKSLGTTRQQICGLFLLEAAMYAVIGGISGILMGIGLVAVAGKSIGLQSTVRVQDCAAVFTAAMVIGLFFGVAPASRAAEMTCVDALRDNS